MKKILVLTVLIASFISCADSKKEKKVETNPEYAALQKTAASMFGTLPKVAENPENPVTAEKVKLGKKLYFDNRLSKDNTQSCNTCHNLETYGVDNLSTSPGNDGGFGTRNSPTVFNAALHISQFWDGREPDVEAQAGGPILNPVEMAMPSEKVVVERLSKIDEYNTLFSKVFPDDKNPITYKNIQNAIGGFERKLITKTYEGINLNPIYTKKDWDNFNINDSFPGLDTQVRGNDFSGYHSNAWDVNQEIQTPDAIAFNLALHESLKNGQNCVNVLLDTATKLGLDADYAKAEQVGDRGLSISAINSMKRAFDNIDLTTIPIFLDSGYNVVQILSLLNAYTAYIIIFPTWCPFT